MEEKAQRRAIEHLTEAQIAALKALQCLQRAEAWLDPSFGPTEQVAQETAGTLQRKIKWMLGVLQKEQEG